jgi:hypothetical protein
MAGAAVGLAGSALAQSAAVDQSRAYAAELMSDAQGRESLLANGGSAPEVFGQIQFRYIYNDRDEAEGGGEGNDDATIGFQTRRTKIGVQGDITENISYRVIGAFERDGGGFLLEDAFGVYKFESDWSLMWGQFKLPFMRQELVSSAKQLAAERSIMNETFNQDRSQGVQATFQGENFMFRGALSDGFMASNSDITSESADIALTGRIDWKWAGTWEQFDDFTSWQNGTYAGLLGGAIHWETGGETFGSGFGGSDYDLITATADVGVEGNGWNAFADAVWRNFDVDGGTDSDDFGFGIQGGIFVAADWELFGRWDIVIPDDDAGGDPEDFNSITVGVNHYIIPESHAAKITADFNYYLDDPSESIVPTSTGTALLPDTNDGQWAIRFQVQLLF